METSLRALIVDDNPPIRSMIKKMLHQMGYFAVLEDAGDGEEAWGKLKAQEFDLVICDIKMPRLDGIGLLKRCRSDAVLRVLPFLMITGETMQEVVAFAGEWGAYECILKPFSYSDLKKRIESVLERFRDPGEVLYRQLERLKETGCPEKALEKIEEIESSNSISKVKWLNIKGECLMAVGKVEQAAELFEKALKLSDIFLPAFKNYALCQQKMGNAEKAIEALEKADSISPMDVDRKVNLAKLLMETGHSEDGRAVLDKALKFSPPEERESNRLKVAEAYLENDCFEEAEKMFVRALKHDPQSIETYNRLGIALRRQGKHKDAERYYNLALSYHPNNPTILYNIGVLHLDRQDKASAVKLFQRALQIDPELDKAKEMLKRITQQDENKGVST
ncbi:MAG: tetratricopeptide repeat protein [Syntrophobacteraceae bacterium]